MQPFTTLTSIAVPLIRDNVDTDTIIPSCEMKTTGRTGLADGLFAPWRYIAGRTPNPDFVLNDPRYAGAQILLGGKNFGCGSSREHAVWALAEYGLRCIIAESFAPIFESNCIRNGVLPVVLTKDAIAQIVGRNVSIDLVAQTVAGNRFAIDPGARTMLREGLDAIDLTLKHRDAIAAWTAHDRAARPWVYLSPPHRHDGEGDHNAQRYGGGVGRRLKKSNEAIIRARHMRREMSPTERRLWEALRQRPAGFKFRRQHPADHYTLDFYCAAAALCIEVDGQAHDYGNRPQRDEERDVYLATKGIATLRIPARELALNLDGVVSHIVDVVRERIPLHHSALRNGPPPHRYDGEET